MNVWVDGEFICNCNVHEDVKRAMRILHEHKILNKDEFIQKLVHERNYTINSAYKIIKKTIDHLIKHNMGDKFPDMMDARKTWYCWGKRQEYIRIRN